MDVAKLFLRIPHNRHKIRPEESATAGRKMKPVYQAKVTSESKTEIYVCLTATEFQTRFRDHQVSFNNESAGTTQQTHLAAEKQTATLHHQVKDPCQGRQIPTQV